jgi:hypothetical protein
LCSSFRALLLSAGLVCCWQVSFAREQRSNLQEHMARHG